jgi:hypothetical protein
MVEAVSDVLIYYARAVELLFGEKPAECWLYMLDLQRTVKVEL